MSRNTLKLDVSGFAPMLRNLERIGGNVRQAVSDALEQVSETITEDTTDAMSPSFLPAHGKFSRGNTIESIVDDSTVHWEGYSGWVAVGFDFSQNGAGGFLITGTPRMQPNKELRRMYKGKKYMRYIQEGMSDVIFDYIMKEMEKG